MPVGHALANMDDGRPLAAVQDRILSANVYIGAFAVADCLRAGAQIVIGGRLTDPALVAGPRCSQPVGPALVAAPFRK